MLSPVHDLGSSQGNGQANQRKEQAREAKTTGPTAGDGTQSSENVKGGKDDSSLVPGFAAKHCQQRDEGKQQECPRIGESKGCFCEVKHHATEGMTP